ncbi:hypothetical protein BKG86_19790 [Mycobacteroides chelonae]|uniref:hypothetical protein n=1 Tax=Mycobacteroides chelonae TaxID=1774 RepID=UPI0008A893BD|nr:hypothetical protein [Mycobacteroides chelonae]OHU66775.1 hypothetical protein BKG86_19790 [Mycobacteroides chelonae]
MANHVAAVEQITRRSRSGSQTRKRAEAVKLNLLPSEATALQKLAESGGFRNVQAFIMDRLQPEIAAVS